MSDDSDNRNKAATSSESSDIASPLVSNKRRRKQLIPSSEDDSSDTDSEEIVAFRGRRPPPQILSDYESGQSSGEGNDSGSSSDSEADKHATANKVDGLFSDSSDADDQAERCPICLVKFKTQEIGSLETCDHCFCVACIQEWAKNVPTCPVDRQSFSLILVREHLEGKVIRQIPVSTPLENPGAEEDATSCEVCGQSDREDRMLLCDWCDHGYHMECLNPPLEYVPIDEWYCPECSPALEVARFARQPDLNVDHSEEEENVLPYRPARRMLPRTRHSERVRVSLAHTRQRGNLQQSSGVESMEGGIRPKARRRTLRRRKRKPKFRIKKIVTDDGVIEVLLKSKRKAGKKRKRRTVRTTPRSVKGRLASKLGMCAPRITEQMIPETLNRQSVGSAPINHQRHQAGIPVLDLFGRRDQLEYFSGSDDEDEFGSQEGGLGVISRTRVARPSDRHLNLKKAASILNSNVQRKPMKIETVPSPASGNFLDSILDSQTLWHSKCAQIKSKSDGSLQVVLPKSSNSIKEEQKIDVKKATAPVVQTPMFSSGKSSSATYNPSNSNRGGQTHSGSRSGMEQSQEGRNATSTGSGTNQSSGPSPLRSVAPIRFRMNLPPRRPNIHSYPSDNIPPPPPLRLRSPLADMSFPVTNSPESSPPRDDEEIDIYSDIEQGNAANNEGEEKSFGTLEPPPEPPFLMTMEPPPEPPAILMTLNDDASDDEATGLVIADTYDPCAVNSDDSSNEDKPLAKPPELPIGLVNPELVANYSSDSETVPSTYNPELPTYQSTPIIGPLPRPPSHNSSEAEDDDEECPNFSMYSAASMSLAHRGKSALAVDLDIPIPPPVEEKNEQIDCNIPLPDSPKSNKDESELDIPIPANDKMKSPDHIEKSFNSSENQNDIAKITDMDTNDKSEEDIKGNDKHNSGSNSEADEDGDDDDDEEEEDDDENDDDEAEDHGKENCVNDDNESDGNNFEKGEDDKSVKSVVNKGKGLSETADDECSTQGDVLDLAIEPETNLENNIHHDENEEQNKTSLGKELVNEEIDDKNVDGGDKSDGLVDITDEEMSVYDCQDNADDLDKLDDPILESTSNNQNCDKSLYSDDDNSLVGGATSAVSGGTLNNSDNVQPQTLPGLEGLETETISESEDVNFDELPLEGGEPPEMVVDEDEHSSTRKKKKKKNRKTSHTDDDGGPKGNIEPLEFEEGEIVEDKPKPLPKKDKKAKSKPESNIVKGDESINTNKSSVPEGNKETTEKRQKKKKDKGTTAKDKSDKHKEIKEKTLKPGQADENISWKKLSKSTKDRNYRDGKEKDEKDKDLENKNDAISKKDKRSREKRKELERYNVRRLISEKPKRPKKDEFGRDISPSKSGSSLSPYRPPRYRSPLRTRNRSRTRSRSWKSRSRSRGRRKRSRSRDRVRSRDRAKKTRSRDRSKRSRSKNKASSRSRERRRTKTPERADRVRSYRSVSKSRRRSRSPSFPSRRYRSCSRSWSPSWSRSSFSRSRSPRARRRSRSNHSRSKSWTREQNVTTVRSKRPKDPPKNLTVIVTNKEALKKKEKKKMSKKRDDLRKKKHNQSPAPSKEVFTSGDNILVSVNFKNANKTPELIPASTPLLRESSKRKRDDLDTTSSRKKKSTSSKKTPGAKKSNRLSKINEAARNAKPVAIIDLDLSPFREVDLSPKEVIVLSDSGDEGEKKRSEMQDEMGQLGHSGINQSMLSLVSNDHKQKAALSQPESPLSTNFMLNSSGPKTPPEPHIKFSISTKPSQVRMLSNPLMEADDELHDDENIEDVNEILHKGPNTPPEPPPDLNTPASPPTTPYDPFDPTKSRSPSPQPRSNDAGSQHNTSREDKLDNILTENDEAAHLLEPKTSSPIKEFDDLKKTPEPAKVHSTPKSDPIFPDLSPKMSSPTVGLSETNKLPEDTLMKPIQKILASANKLDVTVHKSPEKLSTVVINQQQVKSTIQTPKQSVQPLKPITPNKHQTPKGNTKHQLFSSSLLKQVPILGALQLLPAPPLYSNAGLNSTNKISSGRTQQNGGDHSDDMDIDPSSPYSPGSSEGDDLFEPPIATPPRTSSKPITKAKPSSGNKFDSLFGSSPAKPRHGKHSSKAVKKGMKPKSKGSKKEEIKVKLDEDQLKILDELPSSAVEMQFLKKLNRQERVVEEVKLVLKPHYAKKHVTKEEYKDILRRSVPKICHNKSGEINPIKIQFLIEAYVKKFRYAKKKASGSLPASTQNKPKAQKTLWS